MSGQAVVLNKKKMVFVSSETPDEVVKRAQVVIVSDGRWHLIGPAPFRAHGLGAAIPLPKVTCPVVDVSRVRDDLRMKQVMDACVSVHAGVINLDGLLTGLEALGGIVLRSQPSGGEKRKTASRQGMAKAVAQ